MAISYGSPSWNTDSTRVDSAYLVLRDRKSGKIVQILLEETEPDSSQFTGRFNVNLGSNENISPEIYIPPDNLRGNDRSNKRLLELIRKDRLSRKPLIWKKSASGQPVLDVYDTREQAESALKAYREEQRLEEDAKKKALIKPVPSETTLQTAEQAERKTQLDKLAMDAAKRESERIRLEQIERQKAEERTRQSQMISAQERAARRAKAQELAEQALVHYNKGEFAPAEEKFKQSIDLDPDNSSSYFKYGITLYRNQKYNDALVVLKLARVEPAQELERKYYMGLVHYRLGELDPALAVFQPVAKSGDPTMGPSALFYSGVVLFAQEKFDESKTAFETVIDTSQDPRLDEQAEEYLDRIATAAMYKKLRENKWTVTGILGGMYDSNVLLSPDAAGDQGTATDIADFRLLTIADIEYRPIFGEHHEWSAKVNASLTNSLKDESAPADPYLFNLSLPYSYKGVLWKKGWKMTAKPGYEILYMDPDSSGTKTLVLASPLLVLDNTFVMRKDWFSTYTLEYRKDDSRTADSVGVNDSDANKISLKTVQAFFMDKARKEALMASLGVVRNIAVGDNKLYNRIEGGATYMRPVTRWEATWSLALNVYQLDFPSANEKRTDFNVTLTSGVSKPIREWVTWGVIGSYSKNDSNLTANEYTKWTVLTTASFTTAF
ncbi:MAG: tetratricopeptide repeat protein [Bdellovibrionales bacterium]